jgi:hypothetical protein
VLWICGYRRHIRSSLQRALLLARRWRPYETLFLLTVFRNDSAILHIPHALPSGHGFSMNIALLVCPKNLSPPNSPNIPWPNKAPVLTETYSSPAVDQPPTSSILRDQNRHNPENVSNYKKLQNFAILVCLSLTQRLCDLHIF